MKGIPPDDTEHDMRTKSKTVTIPTQISDEVTELLEELIVRATRKSVTAVSHLAYVLKDIMPSLAKVSENADLAVFHKKGVTIVRERDAQAEDDVSSATETVTIDRQLTDEVAKPLEDLIATANRRSVSTISRLAYILCEVMPGLQTVSEHADLVLCHKMGVVFGDTIDDTANITDAAAPTRKEGGQSKALCTRYERDPHLREACIQRDNWTCVICGFNFEERYGKIGKGFIHVHHIEAVSSRGGQYDATLDDVCAVCPNCHAMLHRQKKQTLTPAELRKMLKNNIAH